MSSVAAATERVGAELRSLRVSKLRGLNVDANHAARVLRDAAYRVEPLLPELCRLPDFDPALLEKLCAYATILLDAHGRCAPDLERKAAEEALAERARHFVELFRANIQLLITRGLFPVHALEPRRGTSYKNLACDLMSLTGLFHSAWPQIHDKCMTTTAELLDAAALIDPLCQAAVPMKMPQQEARELRDRAFTAALRDYEQLRLALAYIRRELGDTVELAPSMYGQVKRKKDEPRPPAARPSPSERALPSGPCAAKSEQE